MKFALLAIFILIAAQPMQVSSCDMAGGQETGHSQHGDMHDGDMSDMDCCDDDPEKAGDGCSSMSRCCTCAASLVAIGPTFFNTNFTAESRPYLEADSGPLSNSSSPPFRPPIA